MALQKSPEESPGRQKSCLASGGYKPHQTRPWLGLLDLSRVPSGTFFREVHPASEMGCKHRQNRLFRMWVIWPQKHEKRFLRKFGVRERTFFCTSPPPGHLCGPYFKVTARTNNGNPAVMFSQCRKPHLASWPKKMCLNSTFFRYSARSPHRATKPSRGWLRVVVRKPRLVLVKCRATWNKVTATHTCDVRGCPGRARCVWVFW